MGGSSQQLNMPPPPPPVPTVDTNQEAIDLAKQQQLAARGSAATVLSTQGVGTNGSADLLAPGSEATKKLVLGQ